MAATVDAKTYVIGPATVYYRAVGVSTPWTDVGVTLDDCVMRVVTEWFSPDNLSGVMGPVMGLDVLRRCTAEIEFTLPELAGAKFGLAFPGATVTAASDTAGSGLSSTLNGATSVGATSIVVASATGAAVGDIIEIDVTTLSEYREITAISSTTLSFRDPLLLAHASGVAVVEQAAGADNRTLITAPLIRRQPDSAYREWALVAPNGYGYNELRLPRAISQTTSAEITVSDNALSGIRVVLGARYLGSDLTVSPFKLYGAVAAA